MALPNIGYKLMASMMQKRLSEAMDDRIDPAHFGFRTGRSTARPIYIEREGERERERERRIRDP